MKRFTLTLMFVLAICVTTAFAATTFADAFHIVKVINDDSVLFADNTGELLVHMADANKAAITNADVDVNGKIVGDLMYTEVQAESVTTR